MALPPGGIYALLIRCPRIRVKVGSLGEFEFDGYYVYIGSAQRNLEARIARHLRREKKKRWHVDYLLECCRVVDFIALPLPKECEERIAMALQSEFEYIPGFGSSDSRARSHLFYGRREVLWNHVLTLFEGRCKDD